MDNKKLLIESLISDLLKNAKEVKVFTNCSYEFGVKIDLVYDLFRKGEISEERITNILLAIRATDLNNNSGISAQIDKYMRETIYKER